MVPAFKIRRSQSALQFANRLLLFALLPQLPLVIVGGARNVFRIDWAVPEKLLLLLWVVGALFAVVGFNRVCRQLDLWNEAMEDSSFRGVMRPKTLRGMELAGGIQLLFYGMLLIPLFNWPAIFWARAKANEALRSIDAVLKAPRQK